MTRRFMLGLLVAASSGCFSFVESTTAPPGGTARVTLGAIRARPDGTDEPIRVKGRVVASTLGEESGRAGVISLEQRTEEPIGSFQKIVTVDTLSIPQLDVRRLEVRRPSWIKSALAVAVGGALGYTMWDWFAPSAEIR